MLFCSMQIISQNVTQHYYLLDTLVNKYLPKYFPINIQNKFGEKEHLRQKYFWDILSISKKCGKRRFSAKVPSTWVFRRKIKLIQEIPATYSDYTCHLDAILRSLWFLDCEMSMQFCAICSVASTRCLKKISTAIPSSSSEISTAVEKAT